MFFLVFSPIAPLVSQVRRWGFQVPRARRSGPFPKRVLHVFDGNILNF